MRGAQDSFRRGSAAGAVTLTREEVSKSAPAAATPSHRHTSRVGTDTSIPRALAAGAWPRRRWRLPRRSYLDVMDLVSPPTEPSTSPEVVVVSVMVVSTTPPSSPRLRDFFVFLVFFSVTTWVWISPSQSSMVAISAERTDGRLSVRSGSADSRQCRRRRLGRRRGRTKRRPAAGRRKNGTDGAVAAACRARRRPALLPHGTAALQASRIGAGTGYFSAARLKIPSHPAWPSARRR